MCDTRTKHDEGMILLKKPCKHRRSRRRNWCHSSTHHSPFLRKCIRTPLRRAVGACRRRKNKPLLHCCVMYIRCTFCCEKWNKNGYTFVPDYPTPFQTKKGWRRNADTGFARLLIPNHSVSIPDMATRPRPTQSIRTGIDFCELSGTCKGQTFERLTRVKRGFTRQPFLLGNLVGVQTTCYHTFFFS